MKMNKMSPVAYHSEVPMFSDNYLNDEKKVKQMEEYCDVIPVDMNKGYVPVEKDASDNLEKVEDNIKGRFSL